MRLVLFCISSLLAFTSCDTPEIPDPHAGRYYGHDTVFTQDLIFNESDTTIHELILDVVALGEKKFDVYNSNGFWVRDGLKIQNKIDINIEPFQGEIRFSNNRMTLEADYTSNDLIVIHKASLTR